MTPPATPPEDPRPPDLPAPGPRFSLRFEGRRGHLRLVRPLTFAFGRVSELRLDLGPLEFPLDVQGGAGHFGTRRTRLEDLDATIDLARLLEEMTPEPYRVRPLAGAEDGVADWAVRDAAGTVAVTAAFGVLGEDLLVAVSGARSGTDGPVPPIRRAVAAGLALGLDLDLDLGVLRLGRALRWLLAEALLPHGWRVPDVGRVAVAATADGPSLRLRGRVGESGRPLDPRFEGARRRAPLLGVLAYRGLPAVAPLAREWLEGEGAAGADRAELATWDVPELGAPARDPAGRAARLRRALRARDADGARQAAEDLGTHEVCDAVAVEGLLAASEAQRDPAAARELSALAAARRPSDPRLALRLLEASLASPGGPSSSLVRAMVDAREPGPERAAFAREAAHLAELAGDDDLAVGLWRRAVDEGPHDGPALLGLGRALARRGAEAEAQRVLDRAAAALDEHPERAEALLLAAEQALRRGHTRDALARLEAAVDLRPEEARAWARLAAVQRDLGAAPAARRAEDRLLALTEALPGRAVAIARVALRAAAEAARATGDEARARAFEDASARLPRASWRSSPT